MNKNDNCQICSDTPDSPEPSNVIPSPVSFQKQESDDYDEEDEEDLDIEAPDVEKLLVDPEWQLWSDRKIADKCAVSSPTVAKVRADLSIKDLQIQERTFERNGKTHTMDTSKGYRGV